MLGLVGAPHTGAASVLPAYCGGKNAGAGPPRRGAWHDSRMPCIRCLQQRGDGCGEDAVEGGRWCHVMREQQHVRARRLGSGRSNSSGDQLESDCSAFGILIPAARAGHACLGRKNSMQRRPGTHALKRCSDGCRWCTAACQGAAAAASGAVMVRSSGRFWCSNGAQQRLPPALRYQVDGAACSARCLQHRAGCVTQFTACPENYGPQARQATGSQVQVGGRMDRQGGRVAWQGVQVRLASARANGSTADGRPLAVV